MSTPASHGSTPVGNQVAARIQGDSDSALRRYAGKAAGGAVDGAAHGGAHGALVGAAKGVGEETAKDATRVARDIKNNLAADPVDAKDTGSIRDNLAADPVDAKDTGSIRDNLSADPVDAKDTGSIRDNLSADPVDAKDTGSIRDNLSVGGTARPRHSPGDDTPAGGKSPSLGKTVATGAAAATPKVTLLIVLINFLTMIKSLLFAMVAAVLNAFKLAWTIIVAVFKAMATIAFAPVMLVGNVLAHTIGFVFGVGVTATMMAVSAASVGVVSVIGMILAIIGFFGSLFGLGATGAITSAAACMVPSASAPSGAITTADLSANVEAEAKKVYSVLKDWGMPNENIAGIMGNWSQESGIDPTSVENIFDEPYRIGPRKQAVWDGGFHTIKTQSHDGIGLGGWSNDRTMSLLKYASAKGANWYDTTTQLAFMITDDYAESVGVVKDMIAHSKGTPSQAAVFFHNNWERSADDAEGIAEREADAEMWFGKMSGWTVDQSAIDEVSQLSGSVVTAIDISLNATTPDVVTNPNDPCAGRNLTTVVPTNGGMDTEQAQQLIDLFNQEGDKFLDNRYPVGKGGPSSNINCANPEFTGHRRINCVAFVAYFLNKYTKFQQYATGNGIETAHTLSQMTGKPLTNIPTPYSVGSGPSSSGYGHTLIVLNVTGNTVLVGEAGYCAFEGRLRTTTVQALQSQGWNFVDMSDQLLPSDQIKTA